MAEKKLKRYFLFIMIFILFPAFSHAGDIQKNFKRENLNPAFQTFIENNYNSEISILSSSNKRNLGLVPSPLQIGKHQTSSSYPAVLGITALPSSYDLRQYNYVTPVKNQGSYNTCWAFATYGSLESDLLVAGEPEDNFSENNLANLNGFSLGFDGGGNIDMSAAYLSRGDGPVEASCDPYPNPDNSPICPRVKYIENIVYLPGRSSVSDNDFIKMAIYEHGGVYSSMYWADGYYNDNGSTYYYDGTQSANHAIVIVGWDDNMDIPGAPGNGAWIVRNDWGSSWGDNGYFYVSYYDTRIAMGKNVYFIDKPDINNGIFNIYQYDTLGMEGGYYCSNNNYVYGANVFTAKSTGKIEAVSLFVSSPTTYEIDIYPDCSNPNNITTTPVEKETGTLSYAGFYTINLTNPVIIEEGEKFCIVEKLLQENSTYHPLGVEEHIYNYTDNAVGSDGQSFISCDNGTTWSDLYANFYSNTGATNVCLKAMYINAEPMITSLSCSPNPQYINSTVTFTSSVSDSYSISSYIWNFGDGVVINSDNNTAEHSYSKEGVYYAYLTAKDNDSDVGEKKITVLIKPIGGDIASATDPTKDNSSLYLISYNSTIDNFTVETPGEAENSGYINTSYMPDTISPKKVVIMNLNSSKTGGTATITLTNLDINDNTTFYKYVNGEWINLKDEADCGDCNFKIVNNDTISFNITDGGILDSDAMENGKISDPVVIGTTTSISPTQTDSSGGGGCTYSSSSSGMGLLFIILAVLMFAAKRKIFPG